jgi:IS5 family transposase
MKRLQKMLKENPKSDGQPDLFRPRLEDFIDMRDPWVKLAQIIDWDGLEKGLLHYYCEDNGRPGGSIRLMVGLCVIKDAEGLSNEELICQWKQNPYFQYFCGEEYFQHNAPVRPQSISNFYIRIGEEGHERILAETIKAGLATGAVHKRDLEKVTVDTTVQEKALKFPTDTQLCHKAREELVKLAKKHDVELRQSYARKGKEARFKANKYMAAKQINRGKAQIKKVKNYLGRVMRDIQRAIEKDPLLAPLFEDDLDKAQRIYNQALQPKAKNKLYSWHAPEVECIGKGKAHKRYEFGCKASYTATNKSNFIVGAMALHGNPHDGHTLKRALEQVRKITGVRPKEAAVDLGYKGHGCEDDECEIIMARQKRGITKAKRKRQKRRNAIEPIIGHCKNDRAVGPRNWLQGKIGDKINAIAMAVGFNIRKILKKIFLRLLYQLWIWTGLRIMPVQNRLFCG